MSASDSVSLLDLFVALSFSTFWKTMGSVGDVFVDGLSFLGGDGCVEVFGSA